MSGVYADYLAADFNRNSLQIDQMIRNSITTMCNRLQ